MFEFPELLLLLTIYSRSKRESKVFVPLYDSVLSGVPIP